MDDKRTKALRFADQRASIDLPQGVSCAMLILVFDDDSIHTSIAKGSPQQGEEALRSAMDLYGLGDGSYADLVSASTSFVVELNAES